MIYAGTMPELDDLGNPVNGVNVGNTPRGTVFRNHTRKGKSSGMLRKPAMAMLACGRYWEDSMPALDKAWWVAYANGKTTLTRSTAYVPLSGYRLFLLSNMAALTFGKAMVKLPTVGDQIFIHELALDSIDSSTNLLKLYAIQTKPTGSPVFLEWFISVIRPENVTDSNPIRSTKLFAKVLPIGEGVAPQPPAPPQYFLIPFKVDPGDKLGFHIQFRSGYKSGGQPWQGEPWPTQIRYLTAT